MNTILETTYEDLLDKSFQKEILDCLSSYVDNIRLDESGESLDLAYVRYSFKYAGNNFVLEVSDVLDETVVIKIFCTDDDKDLKRPLIKYSAMEDPRKKKQCLLNVELDDSSTWDDLGQAIGDGIDFLGIS